MSILTEAEESNKWVEVYKLKSKVLGHWENALLYGKAEPYATMIIECEAQIEKILFELQSSYFAKEKKEKSK